MLDAIRTACHTVAQRAEHVRIADDEAIADYAAALPLDDVESPFLEPEHHWLGHGEATAAYVLVLDAVNFGSGYFEHLAPQDGRRGYLLVAHALRDWFERDGVPGPAELASAMTAACCAGIFGQRIDVESTEAGGRLRAELMGLYAKALRDLGHMVASRFEGQWTGLIEAAGGSAERLVALLDRMPMYRDVARYDALRVPLYKRAQITACDLEIAFDGQGWGRFDDRDQLTVFADCRLPNVLRVDGILAYDDALAEKIDAGVVLAAGGPEEVELRACTVAACERIVAALRDRDPTVCALDLDNYLWHRGLAPRYADTPMHRTRSMFY